MVASVGFQDYKHKMIKNIRAIHCSSIRECSFAALIMFVIGCGGPDAPPSDTAHALAEPATFTRDIAPILFHQCAECHRPGEVAPFDLLTYQDAKKRAEQLLYVIEQRFMPPWLPEDVGPKFHGDRHLSKDQIAVFKQWVEQGTVEGDPADLPEMPKWTPGWHMGEPDLVMQISEPYHLAAERTGGNVFHTYVIRSPVSTTHYVKAVEVRPTNSRVVHHVLFMIDRHQSLRARDAAHPGPGFPGPGPGSFSTGPGLPNDDTLGSASWPEGIWAGYLPGKRTYHVREDLAWRLDPDTDSVLHTHLIPSGKPEVVDLKVGLYFADQPPEREAVLLPLSRNGRFEIPANDSNYIVRDDFVLPVDVEALAVQPHAHFLGKSVKGTAVFPDGTEKLLLSIKQWNFDWQDSYEYAQPIFLPKGTKLKMEWVFDNSSDNARNPNQPPKRVKSGWNSADEMAELWYRLLPKKHADLPMLKQQIKEEPFREHLAQEIFELELVHRNNPGNMKMRQNLANGCNVLGVSWAKAGLFEEAIRHFEKATQYQPDLFGAYVNQGMALVQLGRQKDAVKQFRKALLIEPNAGACHHHLAEALRELGRNEEAAVHAEKAQRIERDNSR